MGIELAKAYINVRANAGNVAGDFRRAQPKAMAAARGMASGINRILAGIGVGIGLTALIAQMRQFVGLAERQIQAEQRVAAVVRATGMAAGFTAKQLRLQASALQAVTTIGDEEILELQAILLTFRNIVGTTFKETTELALDLATVMGGDAKSGALQLAKALEDPIRGVTALRRSGVSFNEQQQEQIKLLVESNRLNEAQALVLGVVKGQIGGVARAMANTDAGKLQQARNVLGDMREELGRRLIPVTTAFYGLMMKLTRILGPLVVMVGRNLGLILKLGGAFLGAKAAILLVNIALVAYTAATKAAAGVTAFLMALAGPKGWARVAAAIVGATFAIVTMNQVLKEANAEIVDLGVQAPNTFEEMTSSLDKVTVPLKEFWSIWTEIGEGKPEAGLKRLIDTLMQDLGAGLSEINKQSRMALGMEEGEGVEEGPTKPAERLQEFKQEVIDVTNRLTESALALREFGGLEGVTIEQVQRFRELTYELDEFRRMEGLREIGRNLEEALKTPVELALDRLREYKKLFDEGVISRGTYGRALAKEKAALVPKPEPESPLLGAGRMGFRDFGRNIQDALLQKRDPMKKLAEDQKKLLVKIEENTKKAGPGPDPGFLAGPE